MINRQILIGLFSILKKKGEKNKYENYLTNKALT